MSTISLNDDTAPDSGTTLTVEGKQFGRGNKNLFPNFQMPLPVEWRGATITLQTLLERIVRSEVAAFQDRQQQRTVLQSLTATQIEEAAAKGRVDSGGTPDAVQSVSADEAVLTALQAFTDGIFFVFVNDEQKEGLTDTLLVGDETRVTFLRLVPLAGG